MSLLLHGDCLEQMKGIDSNSVDFIFCDLPYGQTSCKWDVIIPWEPFWNEIMRVKKINTPIFFTTTTKFGVELINNAPKKCPFRWDLVWVKSAPAGFLSAKKMPMRKHEMVYCFYEKLPFYDLSSHKHKFIKERDAKEKNGDVYGGEEGKKLVEGKYVPPLPVSVVKEPEPEPEAEINKVERKSAYGNIKTHDIKTGKNNGVPRYDPPLPVSVVKEPEPEPEAVVKERQNKTLYAERGVKYTEDYRDIHGKKVYDPPLPDSILEVKSTRGKHSTEKPIALMSWLLKYFSKEGDTVLDPTMGSGSTGVACKNMNRNFIGIEKDPEIYEVAVNRIEN